MLYLLGVIGYLMIGFLVATALMKYFYRWDAYDIGTWLPTAAFIGTMLLCPVGLIFLLGWALLGKPVMWLHKYVRLISNRS